jgi:hypothetical protein
MKVAVWCGSRGGQGERAARPLTVAVGGRRAPVLARPGPHCVNPAVLLSYEAWDPPPPNIGGGPVEHVSGVECGRPTQTSNLAASRECWGRAVRGLSWKATRRCLAVDRVRPVRGRSTVERRRLRRPHDGGSTRRGAAWWREPRGADEARAGTFRAGRRVADTRRADERTRCVQRRGAAVGAGIGRRGACRRPRGRIRWRGSGRTSRGSGQAADDEPVAAATRRAGPAGAAYSPSGVGNRCSQERRAGEPDSAGRSTEFCAGADAEVPDHNPQAAQSRSAGLAAPMVYHHEQVSEALRGTSLPSRHT